MGTQPHEMSISTGIFSNTFSKEFVIHLLLRPTLPKGASTLKHPDYNCLGHLDGPCICFYLVMSSYSVFCPEWNTVEHTLRKDTHLESSFLKSSFRSIKRLSTLLPNLRKQSRIWFVKLSCFNRGSTIN